MPLVDAVYLVSLGGVVLWFSEPSGFDVSRSALASFMTQHVLQETSVKSEGFVVGTTRLFHHIVKGSCHGTHMPFILIGASPIQQHQPSVPAAAASVQHLFQKFAQRIQPILEKSSRKLSQYFRDVTGLAETLIDSSSANGTMIVVPTCTNISSEQCVELYNIWKELIETNVSSNDQPTQPLTENFEADSAKDERIQAQARRFRTVFVQSDDGKDRPANARDWSRIMPNKSDRFVSWLYDTIRFRPHGNIVRPDDLQRLLPGLHDRLIQKNVTVEIADKLCQQVADDICGKPIGLLERLSENIQKAMAEVLRRILYPTRVIDILKLTEQSSQKKHWVSRGISKPFVILFCGINGVGKTTTLAKVAFLLKQHGRSVLMAACDTFRAGAIEQVAIHATCLDVPLVSMPYDTDPVRVAQQALTTATQIKADVVLIDTAGRMQNHGPRMRSLARLIGEIEPELVLFVGEASVGNTGTEQLRHFNQHLTEFSRQARGIDGLILTKLDTVGDKVGAAVSMAHELGQQIVFVGTGQTYQDLKVLHPEAVVSLLMQ